MFASAEATFSHIHEKKNAWMIFPNSAPERNSVQSRLSLMKIPTVCSFRWFRGTINQVRRLFSTAICQIRWTRNNIQWMQKLSIFMLSHRNDVMNGEWICPTWIVHKSCTCLSFDKAVYSPNEWECAVFASTVLDSCRCCIFKMN